MERAETSALSNFHSVITVIEFVSTFVVRGSLPPVFGIELTDAF